MGLVTLVLFATCTNVGNLLMVRNAARTRELTVRAALGASRSRLVLHYLVESTLLAAVGCALGLIVARWGVSIMLSMLPVPVIPESLTFHADARLLAFAAGVSLLSALLFGLAPAWRATEVDPTACLRSSLGTTAPRSVRRLGRVLVASQVCLSVVLLVGAGLFVQTLRNLSRQDVGFNPDRLLQVSIDTRFAGYGKRSGRRCLPAAARARRGGPRCAVGHRRAQPGDARTASAVCRSGCRASSSIAATCGTVPTSVRRSSRRWAFPSFAGGPSPRLTSPGRVAGLYVVNEAWVRRYFPNDDPVARQIGIIGVVRNVKLDGVRTEIRPTMFADGDAGTGSRQRAGGQDRRRSRPRSCPAIRAAVTGVNPRLLVRIDTMREEMERDIAKERMVAAISAFFSLLGLLLASIGIFGVASYTVALRTKELAIRRALGADRWSVIREALRETTVVFGLGLLLGTLGAIAAVRLTASVISDLLFGLTATNAANIAAAVAVMVTVALTACLLPAHRATTIDPLAGIREE